MTESSNPIVFFDIALGGKLPSSVIMPELHHIYRGLYDMNTVISVLVSSSTYTPDLIIPTSRNDWK